MMHAALETNRWISDLSHLLAIERENARLGYASTNTAHKESFADD